MKLILNILFVLFLLYTLVYALQWAAGLCLAVFRLARYRDRSAALRQVLPDGETRPVSVLIPAYNEDACIRDTLNSLLEEDFPGLEIILVDDGSTDSTVEHVRKEYRLDPVRPEPLDALKTQSIRACWSRTIGDKTLLLVSKENGGKADALNCGLNLCRSPYCVVLDADTRVQRGSIRTLESRFLLDDRTIVCAGAVGSSLIARTLDWKQRLLVLFQRLEYYRTFYMQRILFDTLNANVIVSGAFAMFDAELVRRVGGYRVNTIGEDMELTMRLHAFCQSQNRDYRIAYVPEARCDTQVPFHFHDYFQQRRRWHIGMIQSIRLHFYMLGSSHYGWAGVMTSTFILFYELMAPLIEVVGLVTLILAAGLDVLNPGFALGAALIYAALVMCNQALLVLAIHLSGAEKLPFRQQMKLLGVAFTEFFFFHPLNLFIKAAAFCTYGKYKETWKHLDRAEAE